MSEPKYLLKISKGMGKCDYEWTSPCVWGPVERMRGRSVNNTGKPVKGFGESGGSRLPKVWGELGYSPPLHYGVLPTKSRKRMLRREGKGKIHEDILEGHPTKFTKPKSQRENPH